MKMLLRIAQYYVPDGIKDAKLMALFSIVATAFGCDMPPVDHLSFDGKLRVFAQFTNTQAEAAIQRRAELPVIERWLFWGAFRLGRELRTRLGVTTIEDVMAAGRMIYRALDIDLQATATGPAISEMTINHCFFSQIYSSRVCELISALDRGLFAGLSGGGKLTFSQRITSGNETCKACLVGVAPMHAAASRSNDVEASTV